MKFKEFGRDVEVRVQKLKNADMIEISLPYDNALLERTETNRPENEDRIRGMERRDECLTCENCNSYERHSIYGRVSFGYNSKGHCHDGRVMKRTVKETEAIECELYDPIKSFCQSCKTHFTGKGDLCPVCSKAMHGELDEVMETFPPGKDRLNAIRGVKAGYGYKRY